ncbi:MAG: LysR family transcriptional regulator [Candidatus Thiothrix putei]|uniref:LysR family transcriptional regulator n=1 Tax=Candidatus Thiothrix putei TaxID=3080811 RepID=A0AA95HKJ1_9GAMM|nr:MAG: LysR family transcriptional regulator [Candidatus Thiothrix putei]
MPYSLSQIRIFEAVAQYESYTRAAEKLFMTQPAVSMQIKQLEDDSGLALFERQGKKMCLTPIGKEVQHYASRVLQAHNDMLGVMKELKGTKGGHLVVSVATTANYFVTQLLAEFSQQHEGINITLDVTNRHTLLDQLENHEPDMVIMGEPPKGHGLQSERLMENPLVVIAAPTHPLVSIGRPLLLSDVLAERFIVREKGSGTRSAIERHLHKYNASCKNSLEMRSNETIKHAVEAGLGLGIVSMHTIQPELDSGRLVILQVENFPIHRHWHVVMRKGKRLSPIAREFKQFVMAEAPRFIKNAKGK